MISVNSIIKMDWGRIRDLTEAQVEALEQTAEYLRTEVVQAQVMPFDMGTLQNESTFADYSESKSGKVSLISTQPYARRVYFHPEYEFQTEENPHARGKWYEDWLPGGQKANDCKQEYEQIYKRITGV
ncbi:MAG: hypothetical protein MSA90_18555 [Faecalicatena sp.]|uniref:hypothetical protein n=1 Tax=Faecalicatena sp. TaxID=2005360 RepID=UPI00258BD727|nr:hypothetical protein [Faecalicatena sp.]MCI6467451.1 hypothetical protein [Faecalicatena sp.]MDY5618151.1 hypothetical protein [Lachnospiraceae bacterium]